MRERAGLMIAALLLLAAIVVGAGTYLVPPVEASAGREPAVSVVTTPSGTPVPDGAEVVGYGEAPDR